MRVPMKKKTNLTAIATRRGDLRQTHPHGHFGYSKHGQGNGAVAQMDDNRNGRGDQWVGIGWGYTCADTLKT